MADDAASVLEAIQGKLRARGIDPAKTSAENLNRAMLLVRGGPDEGFLQDMAEAASEGRPRDNRGNATRRASTPSGQPQTVAGPVSSEEQAEGPLDNPTEEAAERGSGQSSTNNVVSLTRPGTVVLMDRDAAGGNTSPASGTTPAAAATDAPANALAQLDLLGTGMNGEVQGYGKPEGTKPMDVDSMSPSPDDVLKGSTAYQQTAQHAAEGSREAKDAAFAGDGIDPAEVERLRRIDQPVSPTMSPLDALGVGRMAYTGVRAGAGLANNGLQRLMGSLAGRRAANQAASAERAAADALRANPPVRAVGQGEAVPIYRGSPPSPTPPGAVRVDIPNAPRPVAPDIPKPYGANSPSVEIVPPSFRPPTAPTARAEVSPEAVAGELRNLLSNQRAPAPGRVVNQRFIQGEQPAPVAVPRALQPGSPPPASPPLAGPSAQNVARQETQQAARIRDAERTGANARNRQYARKGVDEDVRGRMGRRDSIRRGINNPPRD